MKSFIHSQTSTAAPLKFGDRYVISPSIIWSNAGLKLIGPLRTNFSEIQIPTSTFENVFCKMEAILSRPQCVERGVANPLVSSLLSGPFPHNDTTAPWDGAAFALSGFQPDDL